MENKIQVNEQELMIKEYEGQRVVTMWNIAELHGVTTNNIRMNFKNNQKYLVEGEDYFLVEKTEEFVSNLICNGEMNQQTINRAKDIPVFTEAGYLLMTKPMTDEISWKVQRQLVNCYFKVKEFVMEDRSIEEKIEVEAPKYILEDINKTLEILNTTYKDGGVPFKEIYQMNKVLLKGVGIELPEIKNSKRDINTFITLEELANCTGVLTSAGLPNKQAIIFILKAISIDKSLINVMSYIAKNNNEVYSITYSKEVIELISEYIKSLDYPRYIESISNSGLVMRCEIKYRK